MASRKKPVSSKKSASPKTAVPWQRHRIRTWAEFQKFIEPYLDGDYLFRGVTSVRYTLIPSVGRKRAAYDYKLSIEKALFEQFKREALPLLPNRPVNDWEWLALAQHYGVPTRLLDWSESPSVSLFFAVWGNDDEDAGLYIVRRPDEVSVKHPDPFKVSEVLFFYPGYVTPRLVSQRGLFTLHPNPEIPYTSKDMQQIVIGRECKADLRRKLDSSGISDASIYADLDGLSRRLVALQGFRGATKRSQSVTPISSAVEREITLRSNKVPVGSEPPVRKINPRDPQKGQWGGQSSRNGWIVAAKVTAIDRDWFQSILTVSRAPGLSKKLTGQVTFHLHDSFAKPVRKVKVNQAGEATLKVVTYGAFTVGVLVGLDDTMLEIDLAEVKSAPAAFRSR